MSTHHAPHICTLISLLVVLSACQENGTGESLDMESETTSDTDSDTEANTDADSNDPVNNSDVNSTANA